MSANKISEHSHFIERLVRLRRIELCHVIDEARPILTRVLEGRHHFGTDEAKPVPGAYATVIVESIAWAFAESLRIESPTELAAWLGALVAHLPPQIPMTDEGLIDMASIAKRMRASVLAAEDAIVFRDVSEAIEPAFERLVDICNAESPSAFVDALRAFEIDVDSTRPLRSLAVAWVLGRIRGTAETRRLTETEILTAGDCPMTASRGEPNSWFCSNPTGKWGTLIAQLPTVDRRGPESWDECLSRLAEEINATEVSEA